MPTRSVGKGENTHMTALGNNFAPNIFDTALLITEPPGMKLWALFVSNVEDGVGLMERSSSLAEESTEVTEAKELLLAAEAEEAAEVKLADFIELAADNTEDA